MKSSHRAVVPGGQSLPVADVVRLAHGAGCERAAAVGALRQRDLRPGPALPVGRAFALADAALDPGHVDRPLTDDVTAAAALLDRFADT